MSILVFFFKIYLFFILVGIVLYFFKKYGRPFFIQDLAIKEELHHETVSRLAVLTAQVVEQEKNITQQQREIGVLKKKIDVWVLECNQKKIRQQEEQEQHLTSIARRFEVQQTYYQSYKKEQKRIPAILELTSNILEQKMAGEEGKMWIDLLIDGLEKDKR